MVQTFPYVIKGIARLNGTLQSSLTVTIKNNTRNETGTWITNTVGQFAASLSDPVQFPSKYDVGDSVTVSCTYLSVTITVPAGAGTTVGGQKVDLIKLTVADALTGVDADLSHKTLPEKDMSTLADSILLPTRTRVVGDMLTLADNLSLLKTLLATDTLTLADTLAVSKIISQLDTISLTDAISTLKGSIWSISDSISLADAEHVHKTIEEDDAFASLDSVITIKTLNLTDSSNLADALLIQKVLGEPDSCALTDMVEVLKPNLVEINDMFSLFDAIDITKPSIVVTVPEVLGGIRPYRPKRKPELNLLETAVALISIARRKRRRNN